MRKNLGCSLWTASFFGRASFYSERWLNAFYPGSLWTASFLNAGRWTLDGGLIPWTAASFYSERWTAASFLGQRPHSFLNDLASIVWSLKMDGRPSC